MDSIISTIGRAANGGIGVYIILEIVIFLIGIWILYAVIKSAVKNALIESRKELNYTIRKALLESKADLDANAKEIKDYRREQYEYSSTETERQSTDGGNPGMGI